MNIVAWPDVVLPFSTMLSMNDGTLFKILHTYAAHDNNIILIWQKNLVQNQRALMICQFL